MSRKFPDEPFLGASEWRFQFDFFGVSAAVISRPHMNVLTKDRVVKVKKPPSGLWITGISGISFPDLSNAAQAAVQPPSMDMLAPVICAAASLHRNSASAAT